MCRLTARPLHAAAILATLLVSLSCASMGEREARLYQSGLRARREGRYDDAIRILSVVLRESPSDRDSLLNRGISRYHVGELGGAEEDLDAAVSRISDPATLHEALYFLARSRIDRVRLLITDPDADPGAVRRETATALNAALENLQEARQIRETYEIDLWSAYCYSSLHSYDAALHSAGLCEKRSPDRLEHHIIKAMTYERASGGQRIPEKSSRIYFDLLGRDAARNLHLLYEHLSVILESFSGADRDAVLSQLEAYVALHADRNPGVAKMVRRTRARRKKEKFRDRIEQALNSARSMESSGRFEEGLKILEENESFLPPSDELNALATRLREGRSRQLEAEARTELEKPRPDHPEGSLRKLQLARELTRNPLRRAAIQQAIDTYRGAFLSLPASEAVTTAQTLIRKAEFQKVLAVLARARRGDADTRHAINYLLGYTHLQLKNWREAVVFLEKLPRGRFLNQQLYLGIALWKSGSRENGLEMLAEIPLAARSGDALRIMALHARETGDLDGAIRNLEALLQPTREDLIVLREALMTRGEQLSASGDWDGALQRWRHARRVTESRLNQRDPGVYLRIGRGYFELGDHARARKVIQDLLSYGLSPEEEVRYRDAYLYRGLLHFSAEEDVKAFADLEKFRTLGGEFPPDVSRTYNILLGLRGEFLPLERISAWEYSTGDGSPPLRVQIVDDLENGKHLVELRRGSHTSLETWWRDGPFWHRQGETRRETIPCRLKSRDEPFTSYEESSSNGDYTARIVAMGVLVATSDTKSYPGCLKVELRRRVERREQAARVQKTTVYLAPEVGVVKRQVFEDGVQTEEEILTRVVERDRS